VGSAAATVLPVSVSYSVAEISPVGGAGPVSFLQVHTIGFDPANLDKAERQHWQDFQQRAGGRYELVDRPGRARLVVEFMKIAEAAGYRDDVQVWIVLHNGDTVRVQRLYSLPEHDSAWVISDGVTGEYLLVVRRGGESGPVTSGFVECNGRRAEVAGSDQFPSAAGSQVARAWGRLSADARKRLGQALTILVSLTAGDVDDVGPSAVDRQGYRLAVPPFDVEPLELGESPRLNVKVTVPRKTPPSLAGLDDAAVVKRFTGPRGWRAPDLSKPFAKLVSSLP